MWYLNFGILLFLTSVTVMSSSTMRNKLSSFKTKVQNKIKQSTSKVSSVYQKLKFITNFVLGSKAELQSEKDNFQVDVSAKFATLSFNHFGKEYTLYLPYNFHLVPKTINTKIYLYQDSPNGKIVDVKHPPGVPFLVSAEMLGVKTIEVHDLMAGDVRIFSGDKQVML